MSGAMRLLMAQIDDAPGELLAEVLGRLENLGARNLQLVASLTKKARPGYILYIDILEEHEEAVAELLAFELGVWGYRVLVAEHKHFEIGRLNVPLAVSAADTRHEFTLRVKTISRNGELLRVKAEHDELSRICAALRGAGCALPLAVLKASVETEMSRRQQPDALEIACG